MQHFDKYAFEDDTCFGLSRQAVAAGAAFHEPDAKGNPSGRRLHRCGVQGQIARSDAAAGARRAASLCPAADELKAHRTLELASRLLAGLRIEPGLSGLAQVVR